METKKDNWIEQTMSSTKGIQSQSVSESLRKRLESIPTEIVILNSTIPLRSVWLAAASIALLITINIVSVKQTKQKAQQTDSSIYSEYFSYLDQI
jgi:hypothetical protein